MVRSSGLVLGLSLLVVLGSCGSVDGDPTAANTDPTAGRSTHADAVPADPDSAGSTSTARAGASLRPAAVPSQAHGPSADGSRPAPAARSSANGASSAIRASSVIRASAVISDEQAARIAIRLAQGTATAADKKALHAYLEDSR